MIIAIGTRSNPKIAAICRGFSRYPELWTRDESIKYCIIPVAQRGEASGSQKDNVSKVSCSPLSLEETIIGAKNRAKEAYDFAVVTYSKCTFGVGIEAGVFPVANAETGYFDTSVCCIYNGERFFLGTSPMFEYPQAVMNRILAGEEAGLIIDFFGENAKGREGVIGPLTNFRVYRDDFEEYSVIMALTKIVRNDLYSKE